MSTNFVVYVLLLILVLTCQQSSSNWPKSIKYYTYTNTHTSVTNNKIAHSIHIHIHKRQNKGKRRRWEKSSRRKTISSEKNHRKSNTALSYSLQSFAFNIVYTLVHTINKTHSHKLKQENGKQTIFDNCFSYFVNKSPVVLLLFGLVWFQYCVCKTAATNKKIEIIKTIYKSKSNGSVVYICFECIRLCLWNGRMIGSVDGGTVINNRLCRSFLVLTGLYVNERKNMLICIQISL